MGSWPLYDSTTWTTKFYGRHCYVPRLGATFRHVENGDNTHPRSVLALSAEWFLLVPTVAWLGRGHFLGNTCVTRAPCPRFILWATHTSAAIKKYQWWLGVVATSMMNHVSMWAPVECRWSCQLLICSMVEYGRTVDHLTSSNVPKSGLQDLSSGNISIPLSVSKFDTSPRELLPWAIHHHFFEALGETDADAEVRDHQDSFETNSFIIWEWINTY